VSIPIAIQRKAEIIERLSAGELVSDIAASLGCSRQVITMQLASDPEYIQAGKEAIEARMDRYESELQSAPDGLSLARADKLLAHTRYVAQVRSPERWAPVKQAVQVNTDGAATINIVSWQDSQEP
jgi:hypothetical protein